MLRKCAPYSQVIFLALDKFKVMFVSPTVKSGFTQRGGTSGKLHAAVCSAHVVGAAIVIPSTLADGD